MTLDELRGWFAGRIPDEWFTSAPEVTVDREEILVVGEIPDVKVAKGVGNDRAGHGRSCAAGDFNDDPAVCSAPLVVSKRPMANG